MGKLRFVRFRPCHAILGELHRKGGSAHAAIIRHMERLLRSQIDGHGFAGRGRRPRRLRRFRGAEVGESEHGIDHRHARDEQVIQPLEIQLIVRRGEEPLFVRIGERFHRKGLFPPADDHVERRPREAQRARQVQKRRNTGVNPLRAGDDARNLIQPILQNHAHVDE